MKTALITSEQQDRIETVTKDAVKKGIKVLKLTKQGAQQVIIRGNELQDAIIDKMRGLANLVKGCLKLISGGKKVVIEATDGTETLADADDVFGYIDSDFKDWGCDVASEATKETPVEVHELVEDGDFKHIFGGFNADLNKLCLAPSQIKRFVKDESDNWFISCADWTSFFFLFKVKAKNEKDEFFVASVDRGADGHRGVGVYRFSRDCVWYAGSRLLLVVVPQLESSES